VTFGEKSEHSERTLAEAHKLKASGVQVVVLGITKKADSEAIKNIASPGAFVWADSVYDTEPPNLLRMLGCIDDGEKFIQKSP
jgi:hypothetical protein